MRTCLSVMIELSDIGAYGGVCVNQTPFKCKSLKPNICKSHRIYVAGKPSTGYRDLDDDFILPPSPLTNLQTTHGFSVGTPPILWYLQLNGKE